jgi:hypothetical protein
MNTYVVLTALLLLVGAAPILTLLGAACERLGRASRARKAGQ